MNKSYIRLFGDVHGAISKPRGNPILPITRGRTYLELIKKTDYSIQLGDMGFDYGKLEGIDQTRHFWLGGNHDNYYTLLNSKVPGYLGDYGFKEDIPNFPFFFLRGAWSIDKDWRTPGLDWWNEEEVSYQVGIEALKLYDKIRPKIVLTHDFPLECLSEEGFGYKNKIETRTGLILQAMFELHKPEYWYGAHHHKNLTFNIKGTQFCCINELCFIEIDQNGNALYLIGR